MMIQKNFKNTFYCFSLATHISFLPKQLTYSNYICVCINPPLSHEPNPNLIP